MQNYANKRLNLQMDSYATRVTRKNTTTLIHHEEVRNGALDVPMPADSFVSILAAAK